MHDYAESLGMPEIKTEFTAHLYYDQEELIAAFAFASGIEAHEVHWVPMGSNAVAHGDGFFINTMRWKERNTPSDNRKKISAHELFHVFQHYLSSGNYGATWITERYCGVPCI